MISEALTEIYQGVAMVVFIVVSVIFVKPPAWTKRVLKSFIQLLDRWI